MFRCRRAAISCMSGLTLAGISAGKSRDDKSEVHRILRTQRLETSSDGPKLAFGGHFEPRHVSSQSKIVTSGDEQRLKFGDQPRWSGFGSARVVQAKSPPGHPGNMFRYRYGRVVSLLIIRR